MVPKKILLSAPLLLAAFIGSISLASAAKAPPRGSPTLKQLCPVIKVRQGCQDWSGAYACFDVQKGKFAKAKESALPGGSCTVDGCASTYLKCRIASYSPKRMPECSWVAGVIGGAPGHINCEYTR